MLNPDMTMDVTMEAYPFKDEKVSELDHLVFFSSYSCLVKFISNN